MGVQVMGGEPQGEAGLGKGNIGVSLHSIMACFPAWHMAPWLDGLMSDTVHQGYGVGVLQPLVEICGK